MKKNRFCGSVCAPGMATRKSRATDIETAALVDHKGREVATIINVPQRSTTEAWATDAASMVVLALLGADGSA